MAFRIYKLKITAKTWKRDSHGLFDYETTNCTYQDVTVTNTGGIYRHNHLLHFVQDEPHPEKTEDGSLGESLVRVVESPDGIRVSSIPTENDRNRLWAVLHQGGASRSCPLKINDEIKFGRVRFKVTQIKINERNGGKHTKKSIIESLKEHMQEVQNHLMVQNITKQSMQSGGGESICKICLCDKSDEEDDPLISPCKCIGSMRYVHLKCLQNWVKSKLNIQQNKNIVTIFWNNLQCELCKEKLPITLTHRGENLCLIPFDSKISGSYIMLESFSKEKHSTGVHLIDLSTNENFRIGRAHDCELRITDISVSRIHAVMTVSKGKVYLKDNNSKFGTLILQRNQIVLNSQLLHSPWLQCGRTFFRFTLKKPWFAFIPCIGSVCNNSQQTSSRSKRDERQKSIRTEESIGRLASEDNIIIETHQTNAQ